MTYVFVKSSYSTMGGECVEVARNIPGLIAIRDSKIAGGPLLRLAADAWAPFIRFTADGAPTP